MSGLIAGALAALSGAGNSIAKSAGDYQQFQDQEAAAKRKTTDEQMLARERANLQVEATNRISEFNNNLTNAPMNRAREIMNGIDGEVPVTAPTKQAQPAQTQDKFAQLVSAVRGVESGGDPNAISPQGAYGSMQIMPGTFKQYAKPGESFDIETDRTNAAIRKLQADYEFYKGDIAKAAAAYIGGRGAVLADGSIRSDVSDALGTTPAAYAAKVARGIASPAPDSAPSAADQVDPTPQQMRKMTPQERLEAGYAAAMEKGDLQAASYLKSLIPERTITVAKDASIVDAKDPSKVIFSNTAGIDRELSKETSADRRSQLDRESRERIAKLEHDSKGGVAPTGYRWKADGSMEAIPGGPASDKVSEQQQKLADAKSVIDILDMAAPLIKKATGSYAGAGIDQAARLVGSSTSGSQAASQLRALEGVLVSKMPKMSGPQSDKDVLLYKQMAGQIGDSTIPEENKLAAMETIRMINEKYIGGASTAPQSRGAPTAPSIPYGATVMLKANPALRDQFDAKYGSGAADSILGK